MAEKLKNPAKADLNKDGKLSSYEKKRGASIEKAMNKTEGMSRAQQAAIAIAKMKKEELAELVREILAEREVDEAKAYDVVDTKGGKTVKSFPTDQEARDFARDNTNIKSATPVAELISVGHVDDEPGMLKQYAFDTAEYAVKLYKLLHHYEQMEDHVDFPNWWQHKVMMAREYISKATHYLEFETKEPEIDAQINNAPPEVDLEEARDYQALVGQEVMFGSRYATVVGEEGDYIRLKFEDGKENLVTKKDFENKQPGVNEIYPEMADSLGTIMDPENAKLLAGLAKLAVNAGSIPAAMAILYKNRNNPLLKKHLEKIDPALVDSNDEVSEANHMHEDEDTPEPSKKDIKAAEKDVKNVSDDQKEKFNTALKFINKYKGNTAVVAGMIKKAKEEYKLPKNLLKDLARAAQVNEGLTEAKSTCCGKCGRMHVKGTKCKTPYLKGKDHCRVR